MGNNTPTVSIRSETRNDLGLVRETAKETMDADLTLAMN